MYRGNTLWRQEREGVIHQGEKIWKKPVQPAFWSLASGFWKRLVCHLVHPVCDILMINLGYTQG